MLPGVKSQTSATQALVYVKEPSNQLTYPDGRGRLPLKSLSFSKRLGFRIRGG